MKTKIISLFLVLPFFAFSQIKSSIDFMTGIEYSYRFLKTSSNDEAINSILDYRDGESGKLNFRAGFNYNQRISKKFHIKTGVRFASIGYKSVKGSRYGEIDPSPGLPTYEIPGEFQHIRDYWFLELPIIARFEFNEKKISPFIEFGISSNIYLTTKIKIIRDDITRTEFYDSAKSDFNRMYFSSNLSFGFNYHHSSKMIFFFQPIFRYHFTKLVDSPIKEYLYNLGIELGLRLKIK